MVSRLGSGGFGEVFSAQHAGSGRTVAIKTMRNFSREQFVHEFRNHIVMDHEHIVKMFGWTMLNNRPGLVLEHMEGGSLLASE